MFLSSIGVGIKSAMVWDESILIGKKISAVSSYFDLALSFIAHTKLFPRQFWKWGAALRVCSFERNKLYFCLDPV